MESFLKRTLEGKRDAETHKYFVRFGKGTYPRRFLMSLDVGNKIKIRTSFELANDLVKFVEHLKKDSKFSGKILTKSNVPGMDGRKKAGVFVYEVSETSIRQFENAYFYLLDFNDGEIVLKMKKALPKPGKDAEKIDDKFCALDLDLKYLPQVRSLFFWDVPEGKKTKVEHDLIFNDIVFPKGEKDPAKVRELAGRKGKIVRRMNVDGKDSSKEYSVEA